MKAAKAAYLYQLGAPTKLEPSADEVASKHVPIRCALAFVSVEIEHKSASSGKLLDGEDDLH